MAVCECMSSCTFFDDKMTSMPSMAVMIRNRYCNEDYRSCARYRVFQAMGGDAVPPDLFPNQPETAERLLASA